MAKTNQRPGADAGWRVQPAFANPWLRAAQAGRSIHMRFIALSAATYACITMFGCVASNPKSHYQAEAKARLSDLAVGSSQVEAVHSLNAPPSSVREQLPNVADPFRPAALVPAPMRASWRP